MIVERSIARRCARWPRERPRDCAARLRYTMRPLLHTAASIVRRWADEAPLLVGDVAHWLRKLHAAGCALLRAASRAKIFVWRPPAGHRSGESPAMS
ncbi:hypothetical protein F511_47679 [Dorcoceras hygrometricum]|uniref:Uncharacterized protein n=1 Tax=Dorcoceras hygrometricum TaxID=472368 RepID=A0A2Z6ZQJ3_9LAMI|nr:hypothetical protein F511_47679 [Dorcoceras hygrometricum]